MSKIFCPISVDSEEQYDKIHALLRMNRRLLDELFNAELGHNCPISDGEMIIDALESSFSLTTSAIRVLRLKQRQG
ncbi:MAG: hypothetical protein WC455_28920 [Dehalococcoidia bacterium]|jgi:hypothetical protein